MTMATMTKAPSRTNWWLWGGIAAALIAVTVAIYVFDPFGFGTAPEEPLPIAPQTEDAAPAVTE
jgi:hypothetical protein